ncbi:MAG TPA: arginine--tRNA ligase [Fimbriimonas sp.]|nr:arginine--tRNA ligase [Fimbriimonas sp.]
MLRTRLSELLLSALSLLVGEGALPPEVLNVSREIADPKNPDHGDFATNFAMLSSKVAGKNPREVAELLAAKLLELHPNVFVAIEVAGPGFINFRLNPLYVSGFVPTVLALQESGLASASKSVSPQKINVEFVSVNPNGPITIGSGRGAAYGSTLCNVLEAVGHTIHREYYINDGVSSEQMRQFAVSLRSFLFIYIFGEYETSQYTDFRLPDCLQPLESFVAHQRVSDSTSDTDLMDRYQDFVNEQLPEFASTIANNRKVQWFDGARARQIRVFSRNTWATGSYVSPIDWIYKFHYKGDYVLAIADRLVGRIDLASESQDQFSAWEERVWESNSLAELQSLAEKNMLEAQCSVLLQFGVKYDTWFSEQSLHNSGVVESEIASLEAKQIADHGRNRTKLKLARGGKIEDVLTETQTGNVDDEGNEVQAESGEGETLWLRSTKLGDDMDRVLRRKDGRLTYISSDVAYHKDKLNRPTNADKMITILGPDHHGYIGRLTAVVAAMLLKNVDPGAPCADEIDAKLYRGQAEKAECERALAEARQKLEVQIYQLVRFVKDGKPAPMRKRDGNIYALIDLMREIGVKLKPEASEAEQLESGKDVSRFFYLMRSHDTTFDFDLDLAERQSDENPVFYVQYAHARICSIIEKAGRSFEGYDASLLVDDREKALIKKICDLPDEVRRASEDYGVHRIATYTIELAKAFHHFYDGCRVIQDDQLELTKARLALCEATAVALRSGLQILRVSTPKRMDR